MIRRRIDTERGQVVYWVNEGAAASAEDEANPTHPQPLPPLVFLPGLTADHRLFDKQIAHFEPQAKCLVWDPPAHGFSRPFALDGLTLADKARLLMRILEREGVEHPVLVGQSMGGYVTQMFIHLFPGVARGFVAIDSAPLNRAYLTGVELALLRHTKLMYRSIPWSMLLKWGSSGVATSPYGQAVMLEMMQEYEKREYCELAAWGYAALADAVSPDIRKLPAAPTLLICGTRDAAGSAKRYNKRWAADGLPIRWIEGAGHNANCDAPEKVNALIEEFARSLA
ncbi:MAG: alpha/beta hydrolase [Eggerthellaceae bacterium]|nr:alpha/beta hydrolase [Eggerthellaceae bacterium]